MGHARWTDEANAAAIQAGYTVVCEDGSDDYQGTGCLLLDPPATLHWDYGSCSGCDSYEDEPYESVVASMVENIETHPNAEAAKAAYDSAVSRIW